MEENVPANTGSNDKGSDATHSEVLKVEQKRETGQISLIFNYRNVPGKCPLPGKRPCTAFMGST